MQTRLSQFRAHPASMTFDGLAFETRNEDRPCGSEVLVSPDPRGRPHLDNLADRELSSCGLHLRPKQVMERLRLPADAPCASTLDTSYLVPFDASPLVQRPRRVAPVGLERVGRHVRSLRAFAGTGGGVAGCRLRTAARNDVRGAGFGATMTPVDEFNLSRSILGTHPDEFYGAMGRIVCVCAVLEDKVTALRHALARVQQGTFAHQPINQQIKTSRSLIVDLPEPGRQVISSYLDRINDAFSKRNDLVHSSFPAQSSGQIFGHRMTRDKTVTDGTADTVGTTLEELKMFVGHLGDLVFEFNAVMAYSAYRPS